MKGFAALLLAAVLLSAACATIEPPSRDEPFNAMTHRGGND